MIMEDYKLELETVEREGYYRGVKEVLRTMKHEIKERGLETAEEIMQLITELKEDYFGQ